MKNILPILAALALSATLRAAAGPVEDFAKAVDNAWLKGTVAGDALAVSEKEPVEFTVTLMEAAGEPPLDALAWKWTRTGDDGVKEEGLEPLTNEPFVRRTSSAVPGGVRLAVEIVKKDGTPFVREKDKKSLRVACGALVAPHKLVTPPDPKADARVRDLVKKRLAKFNPASATAASFATDKFPSHDVTRVEIPSPTTNKLVALQFVPKNASETVRFPVRVNFRFCGYGKEPALPAPEFTKVDEVLLIVSADAGNDQTRDEAYCSNLYLEVIAALRYAKTLPAWDGKAILTDGWGVDGLAVVMAAACGEGVTSATCAFLPPSGKLGAFDPVRLAGRIPPACLLEVQRAGLADTDWPAGRIAAFWNALKCEKTIVWLQGGAGEWEPRFYEGRDTRVESFASVTFRHLDEEHARIADGIERPFGEADLALTDKVVVEIAIDLNGKVPDLLPIRDLINYGHDESAPLVVYATVSERRIREKAWPKVQDNLKHGVGMDFVPFPVYFDAGIVTDAPVERPRLTVVDTKGVVRYSGTNGDAAANKAREIIWRLPKPDPVFMYAKPVLLKDTVAKWTALGVPASKIKKSLRNEAKKAEKKDPARAAEARHLVLGMRQAVDLRLAKTEILAAGEPGHAWRELQAILAEWPERAKDPEVVAFKERLQSIPEATKLAKVGREVEALRKRHPTKPMEQRQLEKDREALRLKLKHFTKSKDMSIAGEAMTLLGAMDSPESEEEESEQ